MKNCLPIAFVAFSLTACFEDLFQKVDTAGIDTGSGIVDGPGYASYPPPVIIEAAPLVCTGPNLELSMIVTGVTSGTSVVYLADINNAAPYGEEHSLNQDFALDTDTTETLLRTLVAGADAYQPDVNTTFSCDSHLSGNEATMAAIYSTHDIDGQFADCAGQGVGWENLLAPDAAAYNISGPSNLDELVNCHSL